MQNDIKLPPGERRNYKHALDGVYRIIREEGFTKIFNGATMATTRAIVMTIGQLSFYDQIKQMIIEYGYGRDNLYTHFFSSFCAASIATMVRMLDLGNVDGGSSILQYQFLNFKSCALKFKA